MAGRLSQAAILSAPASAPVASRSLAEARQRARYFFREVCCVLLLVMRSSRWSQLAREIPWIMQNYQLEEITTRPRLRSQLADHFRRVKTDNPQVIDILLFKGQAEAHEVMAHYTQRHHIISRYVAPAGGGATSGSGGKTRSAWLSRRVRFCLVFSNSNVVFHSFLASN